MKYRSKKIFVDAYQVDEYGYEFFIDSGHFPSNESWLDDAIKNGDVINHGGIIFVNDDQIGYGDWILKMIDGRVVWMTDEKFNKLFCRFCYYS